VVKKLSAYIKQYKINSILTSFFIALQAVMEVLIPIMMSNLIDEGIYKGNMNHIIKLGLILLISAIAALAFGCLAGKNAAVASAGFAKNLRFAIYSKVQEFSFHNIDKFSTSSIITRLTTDVTNVQTAFQMIIFGAIRAPIVFAFALTVAISINSRLSLIFLAAIPFMALALFLIMKRAYKLFEKLFQTFDTLNNTVGENLSGIRVVKSFGREEFEIRKFRAVSQKIYDIYTKAEKTIMLEMPLVQFSMYTCILMILWFGSKTIVYSKNSSADGLSTGELMSLIAYSTQILISLVILAMILVRIVIAISSAKRITEILNEESDLKNCSHPLLEIQSTDISFKNVGFSYAKDKNKLCLKNINLDILAGETVGILGGTGSGKTTLVQLIPRLYDATVGSVSIGGRDVREYDIEVLRKSISMVLQKNTLFSGKVNENLKWGNEFAQNEEIEEACKIAQAHNFIKSFPEGYSTYIQQGGVNVSGGQKQRICIARALLRNPKILILDDSTSAVDTKTESLIIDALKNNFPKTTKIIISQRISSIKEADKIIVLENGTIVDIGNHESLLENCKLYKDIYESQTQKGVK